MISATLDRRTVIAGSLAFAGGVAFSPVAFVQPAAVHLRREVLASETDPAALQVLRHAVALLRAKDAGAPAADGWAALARTHVEHCFTGDSREIHFSWWFWPWHRAYMLAIEKRLQNVVSEPALRLPYWDWFAARTLPEAFARETYPTSSETKPNPLFDRGRARSAADRPPPLNTSTITRAVLGGYASEADLLASSRFATVGGRSPPPGGSDSTTGIVEIGPHNNIHVWVGGRTGTMAQAFSPRDPAFILHHCNVDRLWTVWGSMTTGGAHRNPDDPAWLNKTFPMPHPSGVGIETYKIADLLKTGDLGYTYDRETLRIAAAGEPRVGPGAAVVMNSRPLDLSGGQARTEFRTLQEGEGARLRELAPSRPGVLMLEDVALPRTTVTLSVYAQSARVRDDTEGNLVGYYTLLNPTGLVGTTSLSIPLPQRIGEFIAEQPDLGFALVADADNRERMAGFTVREVRLVFE